jgi:putative membrane protein
MSIRVYRPSMSGQRRSRKWLTRLAWLLTLMTIGAQIAYPLMTGEPLRQLTIATVILAASAVSLQAWSSFGPRYALLYVSITAVFAFGVETLGVGTGWPFGEYSYADTLGGKLHLVPYVVPLAWVMMAHPVLLAARALNTRWAAFIGGFGLMAWDVFLDPMMVSAGHWTWVHTEPRLWGVPGIPLSNFFGWLLSGIALMFLLHAVLPEERRARPASTAHTATFLLWVYFSSVVGAIFFFDRPSVALVGGLLMGVIVLPYATSLWWSRL